jgi:hypothetical protein
VVEGWIGREGVRAAVAEIRAWRLSIHGFRGGLTAGRWDHQPESYAEMAAREMVHSGIPRERIVVATAQYTESHRTFESAVAVWHALRPHASRSFLVFAKVLGHETKVGVIAWLPPDYKTEPWWRSSERSRDLLEETVGYLYEVLLNSGRRSNYPETAS